MLIGVLQSERFRLGQLGLVGRSRKGRSILESPLASAQPHSRFRRSASRYGPVFNGTFLPNQTNEDTTISLFEYTIGTMGSFFSSDAQAALACPGEGFRFRLIASAGLMDLDPYGELRVSDQRGWRAEATQPEISCDDADAADVDLRIGDFCTQIFFCLEAIWGKRASVGSTVIWLSAVATYMAFYTPSRKRRWISLTA